jgi:hypothetical protein
LIVHLISEVLDELLEDVNGRNAGRIDGIVLEIRDDKPPRVAYVEISPITLLARFNRRLANWYARFDRRFGPGRGAPFRIAWSRITRSGPTLQTDLNVESTPIMAFEDWLRDRVVSHIPVN